MANQLNRRYKCNRKHSDVATGSTAEKRSDAQNATLMEWRFVSLRWSLASQQLWAVVISTAPLQASRLVFPFQGRSLAVALAGYLLFLRAGRNFPSSRYITGTL